MPNAIMASAERSRKSSLLNFPGEPRGEQNTSWKRMLAYITGSVNEELRQSHDHYSCIWSFSVHWLQIRVFTPRGHDVPVVSQGRRVLVLPSVP